MLSASLCFCLCLVSPFSLSPTPPPHTLPHSLLSHHSISARERAQRSSDWLSTSAHTGGETRTIVSCQECERRESKERERGGGGRAETSIAARLQIHGKPPPWGILAATLYPCRGAESKREREKRSGGVERDRERRQGRGRRGGTGGSNCWILHFESQAVRENTFYTCLLLVLFFS